MLVCGENGLPKERHLLKLGALFTPHASPEDLQLAKGSTSTTRLVEVINGQAAENSDDDRHTGVCSQEMDQMLQPKAIEYLCGYDEAMTYQLFWDSMRGTLQLSK